MSYLSRSIHLTRIALKACFEKASVVFFLKHYSCLLEQLAVGVSAQVLDFSTILFPSHYDSNGLISFFSPEKNLICKCKKSGATNQIQTNSYLCM